MNPPNYSRPFNNHRNVHNPSVDVGIGVGVRRSKITRVCQYIAAIPERIVDGVKNAMNFGCE